MGVIAEKSQVEKLIPQKFPFVMVDTLVSFTETSLTSGLKVTNDNIFVENNVFQESGVIEHMAQSVALHTGYDYFLKKENPPTGYIGSIKSLEIKRLPLLNETIETNVSVLHEFMGVTLVDIISQVNGEEIAKSQMKTVIAK